MIRLDTVNRKLEAVLGGAVALNQLPVVVSYSDKTATTYNGATQLANTSNTVAVDICGAPAAATIRDVDYINIRNSDTAPATVTVRYNDTTLYNLFTVTLSVGDCLTYTHGSGWQVTDSTGSVKYATVTTNSTAATNVTNTPAGGIASTNVQAALNELDTEKALLAGVSTQPFAASTITAASTVASTAGDINLKAAVALADAGATLTATQLANSGLFTITPTVARALTTDTAVNIVAALGGYQVGSHFDFTVINLAAFAVTLTAGVGVTLVGSAVANNTSATWKCCVASATTVVLYRL